MHMKLHRSPLVKFLFVVVLNANIFFILSVQPPACLSGHIFMFLCVCLSEHAQECFFQSACPYMFVGFISLSAYSKCCFYQYYCLCVYVRIHRGPDPLPPKITGYMGFYRNKYWDPPPPLKEAGPPPPTGKCWIPSGSLEKYNYLCNKTIGSPPVHLGSDIENNYVILY